MRLFLSIISIAFSCLLTWQLAWSNAPALEKSPHQKIQAATDALLEEIPTAKKYFKKDPERFYSKVGQVLSPVVDFKSFTRSVMGPFGRRDYYVSLTPVQRTQFKSDYRAFVQTFKSGLIRTYAKGLLVFDGQKIIVEPATTEELALIEKGQAVNVVQVIKATNDVYTLRYKMAPNKKGEWVLKNVVMESINVGQLYQNQFVSSMKKHENNFSVVIENWISETKDTNFKAKAKKVDS